MEAIGLVHPIGGRPVPGDSLVARDQAIDRVVRHIAASPYAAGVMVEREEVGKFLDEDWG
jgi:hypothetical protein